KKYQDKLKIFLGFEVEYFQDLVIPKMSDYEQFGTDFLIGSVHYLRTQNGRFIVDGSVENVAKGIDEHFAGNGKKAVLEYFQAEREMLLHGDFQILGHPDLIRKTNGHLNFFNEDDDWYKNELRACAESAKKAGVVVEINTGGMARSYIDTTYPSPYFLSILFEKGIPVMINSDAHDAKNLDFAFEKAKDIARSIGYRELAFLESGTIKMQKF
ncbi:MAG: histidinol phosphate phosphatase, partial [Treponema sp.]|nr:histidinol phosphate phosphatase [Treponema sp.]